MMKKTVAMLLCLLLMVPALAEAVPGVRLTAADFSVTLDGETCAPDMVLTLDAADALGVLTVNLNGESLGEARTLWESDGGMRLMLGDSDVFALSERYLEETTCAEIVNSALAQRIRAEGLYPMLSGLMAQLDAQEGDQFELAPEDLPGWMADAGELADLWLAQFDLAVSATKISVKRDSLGYTLSMDDENFIEITFRRSGENRIMIQGGITALGVTLYAAEDGGIELSASTGRYWMEGRLTSNLTLKYYPREDGADYSVFFQYESRWSVPVADYVDQYSRLNVSGSVDAQGMHTADVRYSRDAETIPDLSFGFHVESSAAQVEDLLSSRKQVKKISQSFGSAAVLLRKAFRDFREETSALTAEPVLGDALRQLAEDPVAGVLWDAVVP